MSTENDEKGSLRPVTYMTGMRVLKEIKNTVAVRSVALRGNGYNEKCRHNEKWYDHMIAYESYNRVYTTRLLDSLRSVRWEIINWIVSYAQSEG